MQESKPIFPQTYVRSVAQGVITASGRLVGFSTGREQIFAISAHATNVTDLPAQKVSGAIVELDTADARITKPQIELERLRLDARKALSKLGELVAALSPTPA